MGRRRAPGRSAPRLGVLGAWLVSVAAVSPLLFAGLIAPAWAERVPSGDAVSSAQTSEAGVVETTSLTGPARLQTASSLVAGAVVRVPARTRASLTLRAAGTGCASSVTVPAGRSTVTVTCVVTPTAAQVPTLTGALTVRLDRVDPDRVRSTIRNTVVRTPLMDGAPLTQDAAAARWRALDADLRAATANTVQAAAAAVANDAADAAARVWEVSGRTGWHSSDTQAALTALLALAKPGGGYGLAGAWDAYGDGTVNPAGTVYTVTTAGHAGGVLVEARRNGVVPEAALDSVIDAVLAIPRLEGGTCLAYSNSRYDAAKPCVYNVSHGAAAFLTLARQISDHRAADVDALLARLRSGFTRGYDATTGYWRYMAGTGGPQDIGHQLYTADSVDIADPSFHAVATMMARPWWSQPNGTTQDAATLGSAMMSVAKDCDYARSPAVLLAAERGASAKAATFVRVGMLSVADDVMQRCFGG